MPHYSDSNPSKGMLVIRMAESVALGNLTEFWEAVQQFAALEKKRHHRTAEALERIHKMVTRASPPPKPPSTNPRLPPAEVTFIDTKAEMDRLRR